jgi:DNA-binding winged helix-turn-helix (wHTH) protein
MQFRSPTSPRLRFGDFVLDPEAGQLRKHDILLKLPPQPFRLLQLLVDRAGTVVTRDEIRDHLWADSTFVDFEHGINFSINQIRAALADSAEKPRFVETLPRRGYRFIATVETLDGQTPLPRTLQPRKEVTGIDTASFQFPSLGAIGTTTLHVSTVSIGSGGHAVSSSPELPSSLPPIPESRKTPRWSWFAASAITAVVLVGTVLVYRLINPPPPRVVHIEQLTQSGRVSNWQSVISDGLRLFFLEREGDHWENMEIAAAGGESQPFRLPFAGTNAKVFALSSDGSRFLSGPFRNINDEVPLWITPVVGGAPRRLYDLTANDATFSPDGTQIAVAKKDGIYLTDLNGSNVPGPLTGS